MGRLLFSGVLILIFLTLVYVFYRGILWSTGREHDRPFSKKLALLLFIPALVLLILAFTRQIHQIRAIFAVFATSLSLLWIFAMCSVLVWLLSRVQKALWWQKACRVALPILFFFTASYAWFNAHTPHITHYAVTLNKPAPKLRIGVASDIHLGNQVGTDDIELLHKIFVQKQVDIVLLPGDIINDDPTPYYEQGMDKALKALSQEIPLGVFGSMGNHEFYGHRAEERNDQALRDGGVILLRDEVHALNGQWLIIGRDDAMERTRPSVAQLLEGQNTELPIIMLDHRPTEILQTSEHPIDVHVSGHTHSGQIFPANLITRMMYPLHYGYAPFGTGHYFTSSGYGFWGVPLRLGSRSEVMIIDVQGKEQA